VESCALIPVFRLAHLLLWVVAVTVPLVAIQHTDSGHDHGSVDVMRYGAKGDGLSDDTESFRAAVSAAWNERRRGRVYIPCGTYKVGSIGIAGIAVEGEARECVTLKPIRRAAKDADTVLSGRAHAADQSRWPDGTPSLLNLRHVRIDCESKGQVGVVVYYAQMIVEDVEVTHCFHGIVAEMPYMASFHNIYVHDNVQDGIRFQNSTNECMTSLDLRNIWSKSNGRDGIYLGCFNYVTVANSATQSNRRNGWYLDGSGGGTTRFSNGLTMTSPASEGDGQSPFFLRRIRGFVVTAPVVASPSPHQHQIYLDDSTGTLISFVPLEMPKAGAYSVNSVNNSTGSRGTVVLLNAIGVNMNRENQDFAYISSDVRFGTVHYPNLTLLRGKELLDDVEASRSDVLRYVGSIETTIAGVDKLKVLGLESSAHCVAQPRNESAARAASFIDVEKDFVVLHHAKQSGARFDVVCTTQ